MRFLNPKTDYAFKKIFGSESSQNILISFLNAILELRGAEQIVGVTVLDPHLAPKIEGMKDTYLDVRVRDQRGLSYIVEMQVLNVEGFEKRVLYNACKAYVNQLGKGDRYQLLTEVVAVTITDFEMFPDLERVVSRFRLRADENPAICHQDLELVFAELPKFTKTEDELETTLDRWLCFLKSARDLTAIPRSLAVEPAIVHAFELANRAGWTEDELDYVEAREWWIADQQHLQRQLKWAAEVERKAAEVERKAAEFARKAADSDRAMQELEQKARELEHKRLEAEQKARELEQKKLEAEQKARELEHKRLESEQRTQEAEQKAQEAEQRTQELEHKRLEAEQAARDAEQKTQQARQKTRDAEQKTQEAEQAVRKAEQKGRAEGQAEMFLHLLHRRYGTLPDDVGVRIRTADVDQLDEWTERFIDARNWEDIFQ